VKILLGYNVMTSAIRDRQDDKGPLRTLIVFDEAHLFFPRETWESEEWMKVLSDALRRLMRLGRSRGIAVLLSTHRHSDVSNLIFTLTNTKIYFRTDIKSVKDLGLPDEYRETLPFFRDHAAVVQSLHVMGGYASLVGGPALPGHRIG
jgi:DNA helicase HerA-like ATPase